MVGTNVYDIHSIVSQSRDMTLLCSDWRRIPLHYLGRPCYMRVENGCVADVAVEELQLGRLVAVPADIEPLFRLAADVFLRVEAQGSEGIAAVYARS